MKNYIYVVVDIGCLECGEDSTVLYVGADKDKALAIRDKYEERQQQNWLGQHSFEIYIVEVEKENKAKLI